jgi:hypothetical protein
MHPMRRPRTSSNKPARPSAEDRVSEHIEHKAKQNASQRLQKWSSDDKRAVQRAHPQPEDTFGNSGWIVEEEEDRHTYHKIRDSMGDGRLDDNLPSAGLHVLNSKRGRDESLTASQVDLCRMNADYDSTLGTRRNDRNVRFCGTGTGIRTPV